MKQVLTTYLFLKNLSRWAEYVGPSFFIGDAGITFPEIRHFRYFMEPFECTCHVSGFCANNLRCDAQTDESICLNVWRKKAASKIYYILDKIWNHVQSMYLMNIESFWLESSA